MIMQRYAYPAARLLLAASLGRVSPCLAVFSAPAHPTLPCESQRGQGRLARALKADAWRQAGAEAASPHPSF